MHRVFWLEDLKGRVHLEDLGIHGKIIVALIVGKDGKVWPGYLWLRVGSRGMPCEHSNEPSGSMKGREFVD
jgi:hypothetical protein